MFRSSDSLTVLLGDIGVLADGLQSWIWSCNHNEVKFSCELYLIAADRSDIHFRPGGCRRAFPGWWCLHNTTRFSWCCPRGAPVWSIARLTDGWGFYNLEIKKPELPIFIFAWFYIQTYLNLMSVRPIIKWYLGSDIWNAMIMKLFIFSGFRSAFREIFLRIMLAIHRSLALFFNLQQLCEWQCACSFRILLLVHQ